MKRVSMEYISELISQCDTFEQLKEKIHRMNGKVENLQMESDSTGTFTYNGDMYDIIYSKITSNSYIIQRGTKSIIGSPRAISRLHGDRIVEDIEAQMEWYLYNS